MKIVEIKSETNQEIGQFTKDKFIFVHGLNENDLIKRVERIVIKKNDELSKLCHISKNLYNEANYLIRYEFINNEYWMRYDEIDYLLSSSENYRMLPIHTSEKILRLIDKNWASFFRRMEKYKKNPDKFFGKPKIPGYKKKDGEFMLIFTNDQVKIKNNIIKFPKKVGILNKLNLKTKVNYDVLNQIRIIPRGINYVLEVIYTKIKKNLNLDKNRIIGIDLGVNNLVTIGNNIGTRPIVIKGHVVKSINQYYNKMKGKLQSVRDLQNYVHETKRIQKLENKRYWKINDYFHKTSKKVINYCTKNNIGKIVIGYNKGWKQKINMGKINNQNFMQIPHYKLVQQIQYKAEELGIETVLTEESYTSKCSFLDNEPIKYFIRYKGKRLNRGLYLSANGKVINADVNSALNIIKKVVPDAFLTFLNGSFANGIEDVVLHPVKELVK